MFSPLQAWKGRYSIEQHACILAQDILDLETEAERVSARYARRADVSQMEAVSAAHCTQPQQVKLGVELSELIMSEKRTQDARSPKHEVRISIHILQDSAFSFSYFCLIFT